MRGSHLTRRLFLGGAGASFASAFACQASASAASGVTFFFISDVHACRMKSGLSPHCRQEGKTDDSLLRHIAALNALPGLPWPNQIDGQPTGLPSAMIGAPRGIVLGGDMTDDGGGQTTAPGEGTQLLQYSQRYVEGAGPDRVHFPVYQGLGNHDLDQDGPADQRDWYRNEMRDYVEANHEPDPAFKPPFPAANYDALSDAYSWDWDELHLVQLHRFGGDTRKSAISALPWLEADLAANARNRRPVVIFQHYGWDHFSLERWNPSAVTFDDEGAGQPHWWSEDERQALLRVLAGYNVIALFHGHEHPTPMIYEHNGLTLVKPKASFLGGFCVAQLADGKLNIALGEATDTLGAVKFTSALSKSIRP